MGNEKSSSAKAKLISKLQQATQNKETKITLTEEQAELLARKIKNVLKAQLH